MITTKWPRLLVTGQPVAYHQASEILIRTHTWSWGVLGNDHVWKAFVRLEAHDVLGMPLQPPSSATQQQRLDYGRDYREWAERAGILDLHYLDNSRISSSWIGGPHGWCDWFGRIGCNLYNIGKWPTCEDVTEDWETIAAAFPYLNLTAQVVDNFDGDDDDPPPAVAGTWRVQGGTVTFTDGGPDTPILETEAETRVEGAPFVEGGERGCHGSRLSEAMGHVAQVRGLK